MKIYHPKPNRRFMSVKLSMTLAIALSGAPADGNLHAQEISPIGVASITDDNQADVSQPDVSQPDASDQVTSKQRASDPQATALLEQVIQYLVNGPAFDAKVRETVWTAGREVVGVGTYEQSGGGSGRYNLHMTMLDGDGKHRFQQISDGRLAWTRTDIAGEVVLRRVDVGRLDEWVRATVETTSVSPSLRVGGWVEMLTTIQRDHLLSANSYKLKGQSVWVISGTLRPSRRAEILTNSNLQNWPELYPTQVRVAISAKNDPETGFGQWLPIHIEFRADPTAVAGEKRTEPQAPAKGRLITLIELYSLRPIQPPPLEQFRFEHQDAEVNFINETDRYLELYGIRLTERERRQLSR